MENSSYQVIVPDMESFVGLDYKKIANLSFRINGLMEEEGLSLEEVTAALYYSAKVAGKTADLIEKESNPAYAGDHFKDYLYPWFLGLCGWDYQGLMNVASMAVVRDRKAGSKKG